MRLRRPPTRILVFLGIVVAVTLWIGSGIVTREPPAPEPRPERPPVTVAVERSQAAPVERLLTLFGDIEPNQRVQVRAETAGRVAEVEAPRGTRVERGDPLVRIELGERPARLRRAEAQRDFALQEVERARQLVAQEAAPEVRLETARTELEAAEAEVEAIELDIERTVLRAPIGGVVNALIAELGDFVATGGAAVEIVDNDPLIAVVQVPQHAIARIGMGGEARVLLIGDEPRIGTISFIAPVADAGTRTFRTHVEIANPDGALPSGVSAEVVIPTEIVAAHRISPAIVTLNDAGEIGVFSVDADGIVTFHPIEFVRADVDAIWVTGPPEEALLITARPGFVSDGQRVEAREVDPADDTGG